MRFLHLIIPILLLIPVTRITGQEFVINLTVAYADGKSPAFNLVNPGDTVWIQSGTRSYLRITNFHGKPGKPIVFANLNGQVIVETDYNYGLAFTACSFFKLTGRPGTGYAYGIRIDNSVNFEVRIYNNAIIDPGAYDHYETDNTNRTGYDSYIYDISDSRLYLSANNFFDRSASNGRFVNVAGDDFHLTANSPLIDAGLDLSLYGVTKDPDDRVRPVGVKYDIGAYEYPATQSIGENPWCHDFSVPSIRIDPDKTMRVDLYGSRDMYLRVRLMDLTGRVLYERKIANAGMGNNELSIPAGANGLVFLLIQSDRQSYARKIILL
ncbi:MAG: hypothetical protein NTV01_18190 [Bacteroidia bacterium]|nr:hypothetical protein [Bacteroidia bacterium]